MYNENNSFSQAIKHNADYYFQQANIKYQVPPGKYTDSLTRQCINLYSKAIELDPKFSNAYRNRGRLYGYLKLYNIAIKDLTQSIRYSSKDEKWSLFVTRGQFYYLMGDYVHAIKDYDFAVLNDGNTANVYLYRAKAFWKTGKKDRACIDYSEAVKRNPDIVKDKEFLGCN